MVERDQGERQTKNKKQKNFERKQGPQTHISHSFGCLESILNTFLEEPLLLGEVEMTPTFFPVFDDKPLFFAKKKVFPKKK